MQSSFTHEVTLAEGQLRIDDVQYLPSFLLVVGYLKEMKICICSYYAELLAMHIHVACMHL